MGSERWNRAEQGGTVVAVSVDGAVLGVDDEARQDDRATTAHGGAYDGAMELKAEQCGQQPLLFSRRGSGARLSEREIEN